jgi:hypothetical protein
MRTIGQIEDGYCLVKSMINCALNVSTTTLRHKDGIQRLRIIAAAAPAAGASRDLS